MIQKMMQSKWLKTTLALGTTVALLAACTPGGTTDPGTQPNGNTDGTTTDDTGTDDPGTDDPGTDDPGNGEDIVNNGEPAEITYINWNLGTPEDNGLERRMIAEYMERYDNITVTIADYIDTSDGYDQALSNAAAGGRLPDVMMLSNIPFGLNGDWLLDLSDLVADDAEWNSIAPAVLDAVTYGEIPYAIPAGQFLAGMFANRDIFAEYNVPQPTFGYTMEEFDDAIAAVTSSTNATLGIESELQIIEWYPFTQNDDMGWYTWDGEQYNLDDPLYIEAVNKAKSYYDNQQTFDALSESERQGYEGESAYDLWMSGNTGFKYDGSWHASAADEMPFTLEFIGLPGGKVVIIGDYMGINTDTENPEVAYHFTKWMTFSTEGQLARLEIAEENDLTWGSMPITNNQDVLDAYFATNTVAGFEEAYENIDNAIVEAVKFVPGYANSRWQAETGLSIGEEDNANVGDLVFNAVRGDIRIEDYAGQLNELANNAYTTARDAIDADLGN